jgi:hypothetical protein
MYEKSRHSSVKRLTYPSERTSHLLMLVVTITVGLFGPIVIGVAQDNRACLFEPDWRPTNVRWTTIHVNKITRTMITVAIDGKAYTLSRAACRGRDCSRWTPEVGAEYPVSTTNKPKYVPPCLTSSQGWQPNVLHKELPANRTMSLQSLKAGSKLDTKPSDQVELNYDLSVDE